MRGSKLCARIAVGDARPLRRTICRRSAIIAEEKNILTALRFAFEAEGFDVRTFTNTASAVARSSRTRPTSPSCRAAASRSPVLQAHPRLRQGAVVFLTVNP
jgi:DNA-binding response OmpR family regulator